MTTTTPSDAVSVANRREVIRYLNRGGLNQNRIAYLLDLSRHTVGAHMAAVREEDGIPARTRRPNTPVTDDLRADVLIGYARRGATTKTVAADLGISNSASWKIVSDAGVARLGGGTYDPDPEELVVNLVTAAFTRPGATARTVAAALGLAPSLVARVAAANGLGRHAPQ